MSTKRQEELSELLEQVLNLNPIAQMRPDARLHRVHYDWLEAGEHTQRTVARLSQQLRRFLDDQVWLENRRIMDILHDIEGRTLAMRDQLPRGTFMDLDESAPRIELAFERPLYSPPFRPVIEDIRLEDGDAEIDPEVLFSQVIVDNTELRSNLRHALQEHPRISLAQICTRFPLRHGLAELVAYMQIGAQWRESVVDETCTDLVEWRTPEGNLRRARIPRIVFLRNT